MTYQAISGIGYGSLANDKYWQMYLQQQAAQQATPQTVQQPDSTNYASSIAMKGNVQRAPEALPETESSGTLGKVLLTAGVLATGAAACIISKGKSGTNWFSGERWKTGWNAIKNDWFGIGKKAAEKAASKADDLTTRAITSRKVGNEWVVSLPKKNQTLNGASAVAEAKKLGVDVNEALVWTDKAANVDSALVHFEYKGHKNKALYKNGKITKVIGKNGKELTVSEALEKETKKIVDGIENKKLPDGMTVSNVKYNTIVDGTKIHYDSDFADSTQNGIRRISTNRHLANSDKVQAYANDNKDFSKLLKQITDKKINSEGWSIGSAVYTPKGLPANTEIVIKEGTICGVNTPNKYGRIEFFGLDSEKYKALHNQYTNLFDDAMKNQDKFKNVVYSC